jgi:hypothetical protein
VRPTRWSPSAALAAAAIAVSALTGCAAASTADDAGWAIDVFHADLTPGACIGGSYDTDGNLTRSLDLAAAYFRIVDCRREHSAQVLGRIAIPSADEWASYGTADGPSQAEADAWLTGACRAYEVLVANAVDNPAKFGEPVVEPIYGSLVDSQLGFCVLYSGEKGGLTRVIDVDAMVEAANGITALDAPVPDTATGWLDDLGGSSPSAGTTDWFDVTVGSCVRDYAGPDEESYEVVDCIEDHEAEAVLWVPLAPEWNGEHPGDDLARAAAADACDAKQVELAAINDPSLDIVVEPSDAAEQFLFGDGHIAICWARFADRGPITGSFLPAP